MKGEKVRIRDGSADWAEITGDRKFSRVNALEFRKQQLDKEMEEAKHKLDVAAAAAERMAKVKDIAPGPKKASAKVNNFDASVLG